MADYGLANELHLYFTLDNTLPADTYLYITLPSEIIFLSSTSCNVWQLKANLEPPKIASGL